jgi:type I restriction enzyme, S subunit
MTSDWPIIRLGELISIKHGWPFEREFFSEELTGKPIVVTIGNFKYTGGFRFEHTALKEYRGSYPKEYELSPGDILLIMTCQTEGGEILGIPGRIPYNKSLYLHNQRMGKVIIKNTSNVDPDYLYWLFIWKDFNRELVATASGTKILHTAPSRIENFRFQLPPLPEQRAIARVLGSLDDKIELNRRMNATLEETARAIFQSWFVDFDPVRAEAAGRAPFEVIDGDAVPRGWTVSPIGEMVRVVGGSTPSTKEPIYWEGGTIHWATPKDLAALQSPILLDTERRITKLGLQQISSGLLPKGSVLMSSRAPVGYLAITDIPVAINQGFIGMICEGALPNYYVLLWAQANMPLIESRANGTTFLEISKASFRPMRIIVPSSLLLTKFTSLIEPLYQLIRDNTTQSQTLAGLRDTLLPKLLSGEVRVQDVETSLEGSA